MRMTHRFSLLVLLYITLGALLLAASDSYTFQKIAALSATCSPAPGGGYFQYDFEPWSINNPGDLVFAADLTSKNDLPCGPNVSSPDQTEGLFLWRKGNLTQITRAGLNAPGGGTLALGVLAYAIINEEGDVAFVFGLDPPSPAALEGFLQAGLYRFSRVDQKLLAVVVPGMTPAPGFGVFASTNSHASLNNRGDIAFSGVVRTTAGNTADYGQGIFMADAHGLISKVVVPGDLAPGGGVFDYLVNPWVNDSGDMAFSGHVKGELCIPDVVFGPSCGESIYFKSAGNGAIQSIAHEGDPAPGGGTFRFAWGAIMNNQDDIVFRGDLTTPPEPIFATEGLFLHSRSGTIPIARPGDVVPGGGHIATLFGGNGSYSLNNRGDVTFIALLDNEHSGLYLRSKDSLHVIAQTGTVIPGVGTISSLLVGTGGTINDSGQVFFWAILTDGSSALLVATPRP